MEKRNRVVGEFSQITTLELPVWVRVMKAENKKITAEELLSELTLIDDLLVLQKSQSLLSRKRGLTSMLEARIGKELGHKVPNMNRKK